jgi:hypothetical protein
VQGKQARGAGGHQRNDDLIEALELAIEELCEPPGERFLIRADVADGPEGMCTVRLS